MPLTEAREQLLAFLAGVRTYIAIGRLAFHRELSEAQDGTLDNTEHILDSLETEIEDEN